MRGWYRESYRHALSARGISTRRYFMPKRVMWKFHVEGPPGRPEESGEMHMVATGDETVKKMDEMLKERKDVEVVVRREKEVSGKEGEEDLVVIDNPGDEENAEKYYVRKVFFAKRVLKKGKFHITREGPEVIRLAHDVKRSIQPYAKRVEIAGSIRRGKPDPVDVDIVVIPRNEEKIREVMRKKASRIDMEGPSKIETRIKGVDVDVMFANKDDWGAQLLTWTGSHGHNIGLRTLARNQNMKLSQHGLFRGNRRIAGRTERDIYKALGRPRFKGPEERE